MKQQRVSAKKQTDQPNEIQWGVKSKTSSSALDHPYVQAQAIIGNHGALKRFGSSVIQTKLTIGSPNDKYEQEADRIAEQIVEIPKGVTAGTISVSTTSNYSIYSKAMRRTDTTKAESTTHTKSTAERFPSVPSGVTHHLQGMGWGGKPLRQSDRNFFESIFGADFSKVRIHTGNQIAETAKALNAKAFTLGHQIGFANGQYSTRTTGGQKLLAHELTHVLQQNSKLKNSKGKNRLLPDVNTISFCQANVVQRENGSSPPLTLTPSFSTLAGSVDQPRNAVVITWLDQNTDRLRTQLLSRDTISRMVRRELPGSVEFSDEEIEQAISQWAREQSLSFLSEDIFPSVQVAPELRQRAVNIRRWLEGNFLEIRSLRISEIIVRLRRNLREAVDMHDSELSRIIADWIANRPLSSEEEDFSLSDLVRIENSYITVVIPQRVRVRLPDRFGDLRLFTLQFQATPSSVSVSCEFNVSQHLTISISGSLADYIPDISTGDEGEEASYRPRISTGLTLSSRRRVLSADAVSRLRALYSAGRNFQEQMRTMMGQGSQSRDIERTDVERITSATEEALRPRTDESLSPTQPGATPAPSEHWRDYHLDDFASDIYGALSPILEIYNAIEEHREGQRTPVWSVRAFGGVVTEGFRESAGSYGGIEVILNF